MQTPIKIYRTFPGTATWTRDREWLAQSYCEAVAEEILHSPCRDWRQIDRQRWPEVAAMLESLLRETSRSALFLAAEGENYSGYFLGLVKDCVAETPARVGYVNGLYVVPPHRSRGVGGLLLEAGTSWFREQGLAAVELYVALENDGARRFWRTRGYQVSEEVLALSLKK